MERADDDPDVRVMTLRGNGRAFCAGYDITPPATPEAQATAQAQRDNIRADIHRMKRTPNTMNSILNLSKPVIVGVHGYCIAGGTDLAMHCDIVIAADDRRDCPPSANSQRVQPDGAGRGSQGSSGLARRSSVQRLQGKRVGGLELQKP